MRASNLDPTFAALADPSRRAVVDLLRRQPLRASDLADRLELSRPAMSRHLRVLRETGLVEVEGDPLDADARVRRYRLRRRPFTQLRGWLDEVESFWRDQLLAFKEHAEKKHRGGQEP